RTDAVPVAHRQGGRCGRGGAFAQWPVHAPDIDRNRRAGVFPGGGAGRVPGACGDSTRDTVTALCVPRAVRQALALSLSLGRWRFLAPGSPEPFLLATASRRACAAF